MRVTVFATAAFAALDWCTAEWVTAGVFITAAGLEASAAAKRSVSLPEGLPVDNRQKAPLLLSPI